MDIREGEAMSIEVTYNNIPLGKTIGPVIIRINTGYFYFPKGYVTKQFRNFFLLFIDKLWRKCET